MVVNIGWSIAHEWNKNPENKFKTALGHGGKLTAWAEYLKSTSLDNFGLHYSTVKATLLT